MVDKFTPDPALDSVKDYRKRQEKIMGRVLDLLWPFVYTSDASLSDRELMLVVQSRYQAYIHQPIVDVNE